ncbi:MAG: response regulator [Desulfobacterales bacterium]
MPTAADILIVDDEPIVCETLQGLLDFQGHRVATCSSGAEALECIRRRSFDLVFLDIRLPDMDGFQILAAIRKEAAGVLVIMITGDATIETAVESLKSGAYGYLGKPVRIEELTKTVKNALDHRELDQARRRSEAALRDSEERFRTLVESSLIGICILQNNTIIYQNPEHQKLYRSFATVSPETLIHFIHPDDVDKVTRCYHALMSGQKKSVETDFRIYPSGSEKQDMEIRWLQCRASLFRYRGADAVLINLMDITRSQELEHFLRVKSKMISLGRVAAGIAHEIRNPLTGINSYLFSLADLLKAEELDAETVAMMKKIVDQVQGASNKIESVIKRVLDFSRPGVPSMALVSMNGPLQEALTLSAVSLRKKGIEVVIDLDPNLPLSYGDVNLIEQVVLNLIDNAVKSMEKKAAQKRLILRSYAADNNICLSVSDTGGGIPIGIREKIFDPFFTTETDGSGIGLAISLRIINDHRGAITVESNESGGARFTIELPIEKRMQVQ